METGTNNKTDKAQGLFSFHLARRSHEHNNPEQEQAYMRLFLGVVVLVYLVLTIPPTGNIADNATQVIWYAGMYVLYAGIVIVSLLHHPLPSRLRRAVCLAIDFSMITLAMHLTDEMGAILYTVLLWSVFGYGIRYGKAYLVSASLFAISGFILVISSTAFWKHNPVLSAGLLIGLIILPLFIYALLDKLNNEKLRAQRADIAKDRFIANMSHELRTPLNGIIGMGEMLAKTPLDSDQLECTNTIQASAQSLLNIVEDVLDISNIESGRLPVKEVDFNLFNLVNSVSNMFLPQAEEKNLKLETFMPDNMTCKLRGDPHFLRQILINLVGNAIKFTSKGFVKIAVETNNMDDNSTQVRFEISDSGIGIPFDQQQAIFDSFTQGDGSITRRYGGIGLGITIARDLVHLMGGDITFKSTPGRGTTFTVELPFILDHQHAKNKTNTTDDVFTTKSSTGNHTHAKPAAIELRNPPTQAEIAPQDNITCKKVLVITSNKQSSEALGYYLATWDMDANYASSASEAFSMLIAANQSDTPFNAVIIEQTGIDIDPLEFYRAIKGEDGIAMPDMLLLFPGNKKQDESHFLQSGFKATFTNPVNAQRLFTTLTDDSNTRTEAAKPFKPESSTGLRVLVAEDNRVSQRVVERILEQDGHMVTIANDGQAALKLLAREHFDFCIIDLHMPDMSGIELVNSYRLLRLNNALPFIMLTANVTAEAEQASYDAGVAAFLGKPVTSHRLLSTMEAIIDGEIPARCAIPGQTSEEHRILDRESINELVALDAGNGFLSRLCYSFEEDAEALLDNIRTEIGSADHAYIRELLHALKGSAGNVGASNLHERCAYYCNMSENEFLDIQQALLPDLHRHFTEARHALRELIEEHNAVIH